jgi:membrane protein YqaA with SNARE-associated domain
MDVLSQLGSWLGQLMHYLETHQTDAGTYLLVFFLLAIAAAIILPIPIEIGLIWNPTLFFPAKALVMALGKATGAVAVFVIGEKIESTVRRFSRWRWFKWLLDKSEVFVRRYGVLALYTLMSIPYMLDTIPLYLFSILNKEGRLISMRDFALVNFLAGINRAFIVFAIFDIMGVRLF